MKKLLIIGGMGAGKSTVRKALVGAGLPSIDLDQIGHAVLKGNLVKEKLTDKFGLDILDDLGEIDRKALAKKAFICCEKTGVLNKIMAPHIEALYEKKIAELVKSGTDAVVVEYSAFENRQSVGIFAADAIVAVVSSQEMRIKRAVAAGFDKRDVLQRIARQATDAERIAASDVVFTNEGTAEELSNKVLAWWEEYRAR